MMENELPEGWELTNLERIAQWGSGGTPSRGDSSYYGGTIPWIKTGDLNNAIVTEVNEYITERAVRNSSAKIFPRGSIALAMYGATIGKTALFGMDAATNQACAVAQVYNNVNTSFVLYYLKSQKEAFIDKGKGGAQPNISQTVIKLHPFPLPPLAEQKRIVAKLDMAFGHLEILKASLKRIPELLKTFRQSVLTQAVTGKLTEDWRGINFETENSKILANKILEFKRKWAVKESLTGNTEAKRLLNKLDEPVFFDKSSLPKKWEILSLQDACHLVVDCHNKTAPYQNSGIYLVRTTNVKKGKIVLDEIRYISAETYDYWSRRCPPQSGDIIFTREAPMGEAAIVPEGMQVCLGQRTMLLKMPQGLLVNKYVLYCLLEPSMNTQINEKAVGSGVKHLRVGDVESITIPIPPLSEQQEIVTRVEALFAKADAIEAQYLSLKEKIYKLPQALLAKAFRGELVPQDPADEPASALLEKIQKEMGKLSKKGKRQIELVFED